MASSIFFSSRASTASFKPFRVAVAPEMALDNSNMFAPFKGQRVGVVTPIVRRKRAGTPIHGGVAHGTP